MVVKVLKVGGIGVGVLVLLAVAGLAITQRVSDGPIEFLQGGPFTTGEVVEGPVTDWSFGVDKETQFELEGFGTSRTAGYIMHDGVAYMTCDLGFMWNRLEPGAAKRLLHLIYLVKTWHTDALEDGRARLRIEGKIYEAQFVRETDPVVIAALKTRLEDLGRAFFAPQELGPPPSEAPNDVWFFRMEPRG